jgi:hypothetical protein
MWLKANGYRCPQALDPNGRKAKGRKGGFCVDPAMRARIEKRAVKIVSHRLRKSGWRVKSVEREGCGFDLLCTRREKELHVEVKGVFGVFPQFPITMGEVEQATTNRRFRLWVVTKTLSRNPICADWTGSSFLKAFELKALQYIARPR